jgi:hypothetical protein
MRPNRFLVLAGLAAFAVVACQSAPPEGNNTVADASEDVAAEASEAEAAPAAEQRERPTPEAPRAEGDQLAAFIASTDVLFLDVRRPDEIEELGTVENYLNIPIEELAERLDEVPRTKPILTA